MRMKKDRDIRNSRSNNITKKGVNMASKGILSEKVKRQVLDTIVSGITLLLGGILVAICVLTLMGRI